jgi:hypothetical protein
VITVVPAATPYTTPLVACIVAVAVLLLLHVPPPVLVRVVVEPGHTFAVPVIAGGAEITVTRDVAIQPDPSE